MNEIYWYAKWFLIAALVCTSALAVTAVVKWARRPRSGTRPQTPSPTTPSPLSPKPKKETAAYIITSLIAALFIAAVWIALGYFAPDFVKKCWSYGLKEKETGYFSLTLTLHLLILLGIVKTYLGKKEGVEKKKGEGLKSVTEGFGLLYLLIKAAVVVLVGVAVFEMIVGRDAIVTSASIGAGAADPKKDPTVAPVGRWEKINCPIGWSTSVYILHPTGKMRVRLGGEEYLTWRDDPTNHIARTAEYFVQSGESFDLPIRVTRETPH